MSDITISSTGIRFSDYPYPPSSVYPSRLVDWNEVQGVCLDGAPPEIRLMSGEILFIPAAYKDELSKFAMEKKVPVTHRIDIWHLILEPFIDTKFNLKHHKQTLRTLNENRVSTFECFLLRLLLKRTMYAYNIRSGLWDWCHLGLFDVLDACSGNLVGKAVPKNHRLGPIRFHLFYWYAMKLANRVGKIENSYGA
jgi:hypothetical protein